MSEHCRQDGEDGEVGGGGPGVGPGGGDEAGADMRAPCGRSADGRELSRLMQHVARGVFARGDGGDDEVGDVDEEACGDGDVFVAVDGEVDGAVEEGLFELLGE